jgi:lipopolysaccharide/colanic/teichoic acid biosynthesis glycosyltransferase
LSNPLKRLFDILASFLGLFLLAPLFGFIAWAIKRDSPGPVFYHGKRVARFSPQKKIRDNSRNSMLNTFSILKFRTMYEQPESYNGPKITADDDARITPVGRWLRNAKVNELPQLWNVLKGEMSLVGPRPEDPEIAATWPEEARREILSVRPGITSPASVLYRNEEALLGRGQVMDTYMNSVLPSKLRLDQLYVRHRSFWLDMDVLLWTFLVLVPRLRFHQPGEEKLLWGPISRFSRRYLSWFILDALIAFTAIGVTGLYWRTLGPLDVGWPTSIAAALLFALLFTLTGALFGIQRIDWSEAAASDVFDLILPSLLATGVSFLANRFFGLFPDGMVYLASGLVFAGQVLMRYRSRLLTGLIGRILRLRGGMRAAGERVLILGGGEAGQFAAWMIGNSREGRAFHVVGFADDDLYKQDARIRGLDVLGKRADIPALVAKYDVGIIVFAIHKISGRERQKLLEICRSTSAQLVVLPDFLGKLRLAAALNENGAPASMPEDGLARSEISTAQVDAWLHDLESKAKTGQVEMLLKQIRSLRKGLQPRE